MKMSILSKNSSIIVADVSGQEDRAALLVSMDTANVIEAILWLNA